MATTKQNKSQATAVAKQLIAAVGKHLSNTTPVALVGSTFTASQIATKLQRLVDLRADVDAAKAASKAKLATERTEAPALLSLMSQLRSYAKVTFSTAPDVLADFGIHPKARATLSVDAKAAAVAKGAATRAARHTMGTKQKSEIAGDVIGVTVVPNHAPAPAVKAATTSPTTPATSTSGLATSAAATPHTA